MMMLVWVAVLAQGNQLVLHAGMLTWCCMLLV
jgi:hypothetical protein